MAAEVNLDFAEDKTMDKIINEVFTDADRVIRKAISELDISRLASVDGALSQEELVEYLEDRLHKSYAAKPDLRSKLEKLVKEEFGDQIRGEIALEQRISGSKMMSAGTRCTETTAVIQRLTESAECKRFKSALRVALEGVAGHHALPRAGGHQSESAMYDALSRSSLSSRDSLASLGCDTSSMASSFSAAYWEAMNPERLKELAYRLHPRNTWLVRQEALRTLASLPMPDVVGFAEWLQLKLELRNMLAGPESDAFGYAMRFHVKMLHSTSSRCVVESYVNLLEALHLLFETQPRHLFGHGHLRQLHTGHHRQIFQLVKLINTFQNIIPQYWARYPENHINTMIEYTVKYLLDGSFDLQRQPGFSEALSPLHVLAIVDATAEWFGGWTRSNHIRRKVIREFENHSGFLTTMTGNCLKSFESLQKRKSGSSDCGANDEADGDSYAYYSLAEAAYACLVNGVRLLGNVFLCSDGRAAFNAQVEPVYKMSVTGFLVSALRTAFWVTDHVEECNPLCLARNVVEVLQDLAAQETSCRRCFGDGRLLAVMLEPVHCWLEGPRDKLFGVTGNDLHLLDHITSILVTLVDSCEGGVLLVVGDDPSTAAIKTLILFAEKLLLVHEDFVPAFRKTVEEIKTKTVRICCRLMSDHKGFQSLNETVSFLHKVAEEWESRLRDLDLTPVFEVRHRDGGNGEDSNGWLAELSAVGCTPLGLTALYKTDLLQDILNWAEKELAKSAAVKPLHSRIGMFLSQVACLCNVCPRLVPHMMPIVNCIAESIWSITETETPMVKEVTKSTPLTEESLDLATDQLLSNLVCILPSSQAVERMVSPATVLESSDTYFVKLVMSGIQDWCQRTERSCGTGLRLLSLLGTNLNLWLYLESNFHFQEMLLKAQLSNVTEDGAAPIIDNQSLLRTYLLVKMTEIGGDREKQLPPFIANREYFEEGFLDEWPLVTSLPIPAEYIVSLTPLSSPSSEIEFFLHESHSDGLDAEWLTYCQEVFRNCLTNAATQLRGNWFGELLYLAVEALCNTYAVPHSPDSENTNRQDSSVHHHHLRCQLVVSYGVRLGLIQNGEVSARDFIQTLNVLQRMKTQQCDPQEFSWWTATVFLIMGGQIDWTVTSVGRIQHLPPGRRLVSINAPSAEFEPDGAWPMFCHNVEVVLQGDLPLVANALQRSVMSVGQICQPWIGQCFWNILDWEEICTYVGLCLLMGSDFQVYFTVALFRHLQQEIIHHTAHAHLPLFIRETRLEGFCTRDYLPFIDHLESKYRGTLIAML